MKIIVIGTIFVDIKGFPLGAFIPNGRNIGYIQQVHGGVGRNVAEDLTCFGIHPTFVSLVDENGTGDEILKHLESVGVCTDHVGRSPNGMGTWLAIFNAEGDVASSISVRSELNPLCDLLDRDAESIFSDADSIILELDIDREAADKVFYYAQKYHCPVYSLISNMTVAAGRTDQLAASECFICNEQEAGQLFGIDLNGFSEDQLRDILRKESQKRSIKSMIITLGSRGALFCDPQGDTGLCPPEKVDVVDTTGAGDAFCAGASAALTAGLDFEEACRYGSRLAASVITVKSNVSPLKVEKSLF